jgi:tetratricopeptide (TPR) repeat protein
MKGRPCRSAAAAFAGVAAAAVVLAGAGCATYVASNVELRTLLAAGDWQRALARIDARPGGTDELLELLQRGHVLHYAGEFEESNASFQQAEDLSAALYTRSVSQAAASLIVNDTTIDYRGTPHELAMVQFYRAFNYLSLGDADAAQVEARKATLRLADAVEATLREIERPEDREAARGLQDSGFLHWFSGLLFEANGSANDAFVAYRNAARAYLAGGALTGLAPPSQLGRDLERIGLQYGFRTEVEALQTAWPELFSAVEESPAAGGGEVVFVLETGWVATRDQVILNIPILDIDEKTYGSTDEWARELVKRSAPGWSPASDVTIEYWLTVAMPVMAPPITGRVVGARITGGGAKVASVPADDLSRRAEATFEAARGQILFKTLLRALVKYAATRTAERENETAGLIVNLLGVLSERADTRSWLTLPDRLSVARLRLPAGRHELLVDYLDATGAVVVSQVEIVEVTDGGWLFLNRRLF